MKKLKSMLCLLLTIILLLSLSSHIFAIDNNSVPVQLSVTPAKFNVSLPTSLPIDIDENGTITTANNAQITNNGNGPIIISNISISAINEWSLDSFDTDYSQTNIGSKQIAFQLLNQDATNKIEVTNPINSKDSLNLNYLAKLPLQYKIIKQEPINVIFTIDWDKKDISSGEIEDNYPIDYSFSPGDEKTIDFDFKDAKSDEVIWKSSDSTVATVEPLESKSRSNLISGTKSAKIIAISNGTTTISATLKNGTSKSIEIIVEDKTLKNISIENIPDKTEYFIGEDFDSTGLSISLNYDNGKSEIINSGFDIIDGTSLKNNQSSVQIKYKEHTINIPINVKAITLSSITLDNYPYKTNYLEGNNFDNTGMIVRAIYNNNKSEIITNYNVINGKNLILGQTNVSIEYQNQIIEIPITVDEWTSREISYSLPQFFSYGTYNNEHKYQQTIKDKYGICSEAGYGDTSRICYWNNTETTPLENVWWDNNGATAYREHKDFACDNYYSFSNNNSTSTNSNNGISGTCDWSESVSPVTNYWTETDSTNCSNTCTSTCLRYTTDCIEWNAGKCVGYGPQYCASWSSGTCRCSNSNGCASAMDSCSYGGGSSCTASDSASATHYYGSATWTASDGQTTNDSKDGCSGVSFGNKTFTHSETYSDSGNGNNMHYQCSSGDIDINGYCYETLNDKEYIIINK